MNSLGPPNRGGEPLHVLAMALALVLAAIAGAGLGFLIDFVGGGDTQEEAGTDAG